ncbi:SHOCT domain-containing protein [Mycolicibacterium mageritense]|uniref:SHOCT domain-containing protein n=1 Tax=Mycolicibacterium mageritense TaxID=53462 RepID=UPI0027E22C93|nr:SHOCT domain-containing protein [Mycolicibacterium mageritense]
MGIGMILFWSLIIVGIIVLIRFTAASKIGPTAHPPTPEQVLADRFARGEISDTEYRDRLAVLRGHTRH